MTVPEEQRRLSLLTSSFAQLLQALPAGLGLIPIQPAACETSRWQKGLGKGTDVIDPTPPFRGEHLEMPFLPKALKGKQTTNPQDFSGPSSI